MLITDVFQQETCQLLTWLGELRGRARSAATCQLSGWLLSTREWVTAAVATAPPLILVSNILGWKEANNPAGPRFGSGLLSRFLPLMAAMHFLHYTPFPPWFCMEAAIMQLWQNGSPSYVQHHHCPATHLCVCRTGLITQWFLIAVVLFYKHHARLQRIKATAGWRGLAPIVGVTTDWRTEAGRLRAAFCKVHICCESALPWSLPHTHCHCFPLSVAASTWSKRFGGGVPAGAMSAGLGATAGLVGQAGTCCWCTPASQCFSRPTCMLSSLWRDPQYKRKKWTGTWVLQRWLFHYFCS